MTDSIMLQPKKTWLERARETSRFHYTNLKADPAWKLGNTAKLLKRSIGSISEDLLIASWYKTHGKELETFEYAKEALEFIRDKKRELNLECEE